MTSNEFTPAARRELWVSVVPVPGLLEPFGNNRFRCDSVFCVCSSLSGCYVCIVLPASAFAMSAWDPTGHIQHLDFEKLAALTSSETFQRCHLKRDPLLTSCRCRTCFPSSRFFFEIKLAVCSWACRMLGGSDKGCLPRCFLLQAEARNVQTTALGAVM